MLYAFEMKGIPRAFAAIFVVVATCGIVDAFLPSAVKYRCANGRMKATERKQQCCGISTARASRVPPLFMVSATFGEKINTDKVMLDKTAKEAIAGDYSDAIKKCPAFLEEIGHGENREFTEEELRSRLQVAHIFVKMANLVILSRGRDILAEDFKFYSPGTGKLDRDAFLRMTKTLDVGFSSFSVDATDFQAYRDGVVSFRRSFKTLHDGYLKVGSKTYPPTNTKVVSDIDLCTVSFDDAGIARSYTYGLMVEPLRALEDPDAMREIDELQKRMDTQAAKMDALAGQESSIAYTKCKQDIDAMLIEQEQLKDKVNCASNSQELGGLPGLFAAIGAEYPDNLKDLEGTDAYGNIDGDRISGFSFPSEVRQYTNVDQDLLEEMQRVRD